jgi:hypothetical protein
MLDKKDGRALVSACGRTLRVNSNGQAFLKGVCESNAAGADLVLGSGRNLGFGSNFGFGFGFGFGSD